MLYTYIYTHTHMFNVLEVFFCTHIGSSSIFHKTTIASKFLKIKSKHKFKYKTTVRTPLKKKFKKHVFYYVNNFPALSIALQIKSILHQILYGKLQISFDKLHSSKKNTSYVYFTTHYIV